MQRRSSVAAVRRSRPIMWSHRSKGSGTAPARKSKWKLRRDATSIKLCLLLLQKPYLLWTDEMGSASSYSTAPNFPALPMYSEVTTRVQHGWFHYSVPNVDQSSFSLRMEGLFTPKQSGVHTLALNGVGWSKLYLNEEGSDRSFPRFGHGKGDHRRSGAQGR